MKPVVTKSSMTLTSTTDCADRMSGITARSSWPKASAGGASGQPCQKVGAWVRSGQGK